MIMATDYSRHVFKELERVTAENEYLKKNVIPKLKKEYEVKLYDERVSAAEKNSALRKEKDSEISELKEKVSDLQDQRCELWLCLELEQIANVLICFSLFIKYSSVNPFFFHYTKLWFVIVPSDAVFPKMIIYFRVRFMSFFFT